MTRQPGRSSRRHRTAEILEGLQHRIGLGLAIMLFIMAGFSLFVTVLFLFRGQAPFHANGTTYGATVLTYLAAGVVGGVSLGVALPLARWRWGSALAGGIAAIPVYGSVVVVQSGPPWTWDRWDLTFVIVAGLVVGGGVGYVTDRSLTTPR